jgi:tight adherence protein B
MLPFILVVVFLCTFGVIVASYAFLYRRALARQYAAKRRIRAQGHDVNPDVSIWRDSAASAIPTLNNWLDQFSHTEWLRRELRTAGVGSRPGEIMLGAAVLGFSAYLVGLITIGNRLVAIAFALLAAAVPYVYIRRRKRARLRRIEEQLPEAMDMLVNAMRAGYSFQAAMEFVGREVPAPLGEEFARFHEEHRLGVDVRTALLNLLGRVPSVDLKMFATAVLIQRETGGNLGEVLTNISAMLRERFRIQGELRTLTAHVRLSSKILGVLPIALAGLTLAANPEFVAPLYLEPLGRTMIGIAVVAQILGFAVMHRLADIEF